MRQTPLLLSALVAGTPLSLKGSRNRLYRVSLHPDPVSVTVSPPTHWLAMGGRRVASRTFFLSFLSSFFISYPPFTVAFFPLAQGRTQLLPGGGEATYQVKAATLTSTAETLLLHPPVFYSEFLFIPLFFSFPSPD